MKHFTILLLLISIINFQSCKKDKIEDNTPKLKEIRVSRTITNGKLLNLSWEKVDDIEWYFLYLGKKGEEKQEYIPNFNDGKYRIFISDLEIGDYEAVVQGKDKESDGKVVAESTKLEFTIDN